MSEESKNEPVEPVTSTDTEIKKTKKKKGVLSRLWGAMFRLGGDDFEKRLQYISKEEAAVLARITKRSVSWRRTYRQLIILSVVSEIIAVGYAIMTTRSLHLNWQMRALRVLPMFLLPVIFFITYSALRSFTRMRDSKDHRTLEKLRAERLAKINELKEKTNYYTTQQLIQRYDPDPAAKAAAATVLASKLGAESGLKVYVGDDSNINAPTGKSNDVEVATGTGLRNRKQILAKSISLDSGFPDHPEEAMLNPPGVEVVDLAQQNPLVVNHHSQSGPSTQDGGWIARLAALLVGEDPTQSYALICGNCHMHNGLARKEDFPYITYYCPHCHALNRPKQADDRLSGSTSPTVTTSKATPKQADDHLSVAASPAITASKATPKQADDRLSVAASPAITASKATPKQADDCLSVATPPAVTTSKASPKQADDRLSGATSPAKTTSNATPEQADDLHSGTTTASWEIVDNTEDVPNGGGSTGDSSSSPVSTAEISES